VRAAALAYDGGKGVRNIVLTVGHVWGAEYPSVAELMARELEEKYHVPKKAIIVVDDAFSTYREVEAFLELKRQRGWTRLLDISTKSHLWTIPGVYKQFGENVVYRSVESILKNKDINPQVKRLVRRLGRSRYELFQILYEEGKWIAMHMPNFDYRKAEERNRRVRTKKADIIMIPIINKPLKTDVYELEAKRALKKAA
jgi:uncharacterized SAM-binding protein YcdF (DUF218 family)